MNKMFKTVVASAAFVAAGLANAASVTVPAAGDATSGAWTLSNVTGTGTLSFSSSLIGALNAGGIVVEQIDPAAVTAIQNKKNKYTSVSAAAPISSLTGDLTGNTFTATEVKTLGGAKQTSEFDDFAIKDTGGFLEIKNLRVDLVAKKVYADLNGANGVGEHLNFEMWNITNISGDPTSFAVHAGLNTSVNELTGLTINATAFSLFAQALALTDNVGVPSLQTVTDFGKITSTISFTATAVTPAVPEPSTYALLGAGLAVMGASMMRRRAK